MTTPIFQYIYVTELQVGARPITQVNATQARFHCSRNRENCRTQPTEIY